MSRPPVYPQSTCWAVICACSQQKADKKDDTILKKDDQDKHVK